MDLAEGRPAFTGRGQKPSNSEVLAAIAAIKKCQQARQKGSFFSSDKQKEQPCSCGWHTKAAARKQSRLQVAQSSSAMTSATSSSVTATTTSAMAGTSVSDSGSSLVVPVSSSPPPTVFVTSTGATTTIATTTTTTTSLQPGSGPVAPKFDKSDFQSPTIGELRAIEIGSKTSPGK